MSKTKARVKKTQKTRTPLKIYLLLMTLTGVIGSLISIGILVFSVAEDVIITDQEYIVSERYYELDQCKNPVLKPVTIETASSIDPEMTLESNIVRMDAPQENYVNPTKEEIESCKTEKTEQLISSRKANFKIDMLNS